MSNNGKLLTVSCMAREARMSHARMRKLIESGEGPRAYDLREGFPPPRQWRVREEDFQRWWDSYRQAVV